MQLACNFFVVRPLILWSGQGFDSPMLHFWRAQIVRALQFFQSVFVRFGVILSGIPDEKPTYRNTMQPGCNSPQNRVPPDRGPTG